MAEGTGRGGRAKKLQDDLPALLNPSEQPGVVLPRMRRGGQPLQQYHALPEHLLDGRDAARRNRGVVKKIGGGYERTVIDPLYGDILIYVTI